MIDAACKHPVSQREKCSQQVSRAGGFTLIELMVYIAIVGIVVIVAGQAYSNSTKMRVRTQSMVKASEVAENAASLFKSDVAQTGAKSSMEAGAAGGGASYGNKFGAVNSNVYIHPVDDDADLRDSSSYTITTDESGNSSLVLRRIRYNAQGYYQAVEEVNWFVDGSTLKRSCRTIDKADAVPNDEDCAEVAADVARGNAVDIAENVNSFTVQAAVPSVLEGSTQVFPPGSTTEFRLVPRTGIGQYVMFSSANTSGEQNKGGTGIVLSQFFSNYNVTSEDMLDLSNRKVNQAFAIRNETTTETSWRNLCANYGSLTLEKGAEYEISFKMDWQEDNSRLFVPGKDHMSVGFRTISNGEIPTKDDVKLLEDFLFFPPVNASGNGKRVMRFTPPENIPNVCMAFTFACYSPLVSQGKIVIKDLRLRKVPGAAYNFNGAAIATNDKKNVKAMRLNLSIKRNGEEGAVSVVVWTPSNGPSD